MSIIIAFPILTTMPVGAIASALIWIPVLAGDGQSLTRLNPYSAAAISTW
ncbi:MAG: hypothetical protein LDL41_00500 [Coleofasciculus sp. S288]|nr:hypothetical protein [Coleofasciculus sp. S288]